MGPHAPVWLHRFIILSHSVLVVSVTLGYFTISLYPFSEPMCEWYKIYLILYWMELKIQIAASGMVFLKDLLNFVLVTCREYGRMQKKMEVTGFLMGVK